MLDRTRHKETILNFRAEAMRQVAWLIHLIRNEGEMRSQWGSKSYRLSLSNAKENARDAFTRVARYIRTSASVRFDRLCNPHKVVEPIPWKLLLVRDGTKRVLVNTHTVPEDEIDGNQ